MTHPHSSKPELTSHLEGLIRKWRENGSPDYCDEKGTWRDCADELEAALSALPGGGVDAKREAWAIVRPDGVTIHPESVRGNEHAAQWSIGNWVQMQGDGFTCRRVTIAALPTPTPHEADRNE